MALMEAGMFGLGVPEISAIVMLALVIFSGGRKFGGGQPPTHPLPGIDPKLSAGSEQPVKDLRIF
jgi:hypothetical protein